MRCISALVLGLLLTLAGCETRRSYLEALNEYRVKAPTLNYQKSLRRSLRAERDRELKKAEKPMRIFGTVEFNMSEAELADRNREHKQKIIAHYDARIRENDQLIRQLEPEVESLKARLKPEDLDLRPPESKGE